MNSGDVKWRSTKDFDLPENAPILAYVDHGKYQEWRVTNPASREFFNYEGRVTHFALLESPEERGE